MMYNTILNVFSAVQNKETDLVSVNGQEINWPL